MDQYRAFAPRKQLNFLLPTFLVDDHTDVAFSGHAVL